MPSTEEPVEGVDVTPVGVVDGFVSVAGFAGVVGVVGSTASFSNTAWMETLPSGHLEGVVLDGDVALQHVPLFEVVALVRGGRQRDLAALGRALDIRGGGAAFGRGDVHGVLRIAHAPQLGTVERVRGADHHVVVGVAEDAADRG